MSTSSKEEHILSNSDENRKELRLKGNIEVPFNPAGTPMGLSPEKTRMKKTRAVQDMEAT